MSLFIVSWSIKTAQHPKETRLRCPNTIVPSQYGTRPFVGHRCVSLLGAFKFVTQMLDFGGHLVLIKLHEDFLEHFKSEAKGFWIS